MATYLQGVTDYIPEFQPFQPDLNFYSNVLQTKQTQYDNNWKALNKIYGQYFYSDLSREDNIKIKDELMKNIDFNLKRISGLDLSLEQNVEQAAQVFKPFYEDKYLMKDMAYTKNYLNQRNRGLSLKNSKDAEDREQYWDTGIKALDYQREEFRGVTREESLNIGSTTYTPNVNAFDKYAKIAKEWGISADITTPDASGMYMIRQKNGDLILPTLQTLFEAYAANDPALQAKYFTEAYVNRKDTVYQNAQKFNGDLNAAERDYLTQAAKTVSNYVAKKKEDYEKQNNAVQSEQKRVNTVIEKNEDNIFTNTYLDRLNEAAGYTEAAAASSEKLDKEVNGGTFDMSEDVEQLRRKVDAGIASMLMEAGINSAAYTYSRKDMKYEMKESQRGLESIRQQNRLAAIKAKGEQDAWNIKLKHNLDTGVWLLDENNNPYPKDLSYYNPNPVNVVGEEGEEEGEKRDILDENKFAMDETAKNYSKDWVEAAYNLVEEAYNKNLISPGEYGKFFSEETYATAKGASKEMFNFVNPNMKSGEKPSAVQSVVNRARRTSGVLEKGIANLYYKNPKEFIDDYQKDPSSFLYGQAESLGLIKLRVDSLASKLRGDKSIGDNYIYETAQSGQKMDQFIMHAGAVKMINDYNSNAIKEGLKSNPMLKDFANTDKKAYDIMVNTFFDGKNVIGKDAFVALMKSRLEPSEQKDYNISGQIANENLFKANKLTREILSENIEKTQNNLSQGQKNSLINRILYSQKLYHQRQEQNKKKGVRESEFAQTQRQLNPAYFVQQDFLESLNDQEGLARSVYDEMFSEYNKIVQDPKKLRILTPLLNDVMTSGGRAAQYARGESGVEVHLGAPSSFKPFVEFIQNDMRNMKLGDLNNTAISIIGTSKYAFDKTKELTIKDSGAQRDMLYRMIQDLYSEIRQNSKTKPFRFAQRQVAGERRDLGAMVIYPDKEFLEKYKAGKDEPGFGAAEIDNMLRYGISVIGPRQNFTNSLFTQNFWTPMQIAVKSSPNKSVTLTNPFGAGSVKINEVKMGAGDYGIDVTMNELKPDGNIITLNKTMPKRIYGNNLDFQAQQLMNDLMILSQNNLQIYRGLPKELKQKVSQSPIFKNIPVSMTSLN